MINIKKIFVALASLFIGVSTVSAITCDEVILNAGNGFEYETGIIMEWENYTGKPFIYHEYIFNKDTGAAFTAYCRNPGWTNGSSKSNKFVCTETLLDSTNSVDKNAYDAGIIAILKNGYSSKNSASYNLPSKQEYVATTLALRVYEMLWNVSNTNGGNTTSNYKYHQYYADMFLNDASLENKIKKAVGDRGVIKGYYKNSKKNVKGWTLGIGGKDITDDIEDETRSLLEIGLDGAIEFRQKGIAKITWDDKPRVEDLNTANPDTYGKAVNYNVKLENFRDDSWVKATFNCSNCARAGVEYTIKINGKDVGTRMPDNLLADDYKINSGDNVTVRVEFTGKYSENNCENIDYGFTVSYYDISVSTETFNIQSAGCKTSDTCQEFYLLYADDVVQVMSTPISGTVSTCKDNCDYIKRKCESDKAAGVTNSNACKTFEEDWHGTCTPLCEDLENWCEQDGIDSPACNSLESKEFIDSDGTIYKGVCGNCSYVEDRCEKLGHNSYACKKMSDNWPNGCPTACTTLETQCYQDGINSLACQTFESRYNGLCGSCEYVKSKCDQYGPDSYACKKFEDEWNKTCDGNYKCTDWEEKCYQDGIGSRACQTFENSYGGTCGSCEYVKSKCEQYGPNSYACEKINEKWPNGCSDNRAGDCTAWVGNAACSASNTEIDIKEGMVLGTNSCQEPTETNILKCVIDKGTDVAGNSLKATNIISNNPYCEVFCKEDYHLTLPGNQETKSGRYFTLKAQISGTKTCYTTEINRNLYVEKFEDQRKTVIDNYNKWSFYNGLNSASYTETPHDWRLDAGSEYCDCSDEDDSSICIEEDNKISWTSYRETYYDYSYTWSFNAYTNSGGTFSRIQAESLASQLLPGYRISCSVSGNKVTCSYSSRGQSGSKPTCSRRYVTNSRNGIKLPDVSGYLSSAATNLINAISNLEQTTKKYNDCTTWATNSMSYTLNPKVYFDYEETYSNINSFNKILDTDGNVSEIGRNQKYCYYSNGGSVSENYEECNGGWITNITDSSYETMSGFVCVKSGASFTCGNNSVLKAYKISKASRVKASITKEGKYITPTQAHNIYPSGSIGIAGSGADISNSSELTNGLPVGLGTNQGVYTFALKVEDLGEYYNGSGNKGRIWGASNSVVAHVTNENATCYTNSAMKPSTKVDNNSFTGGVYVCAYKVNCPNCPVECDENGCYNPNCSDNKCPVECDDCIYNNGDLNVNFRPVTPGDLNPNDRDLGSNWSFDTITTAVELKAYATTEEIKKAGEAIYDITFDTDNTTYTGDFAMIIELNSSARRIIEGYNNDNKNNGGFANNSLKCYKHENGGKIYENIYCYSELLDKLVANSNSSRKQYIKFFPERPTDEADRMNIQNSAFSGYWTTWSKAAASWNINTINGLYNYGSNNIGPSWK